MDSDLWRGGGGRGEGGGGGGGVDDDKANYFLRVKQKQGQEEGERSTEFDSINTKTTVGKWQG